MSLNVHDDFPVGGGRVRIGAGRISFQWESTNGFRDGLDRAAGHDGPESGHGILPVETLVELPGISDRPACAERSDSILTPTKAYLEGTMDSISIGRRGRGFHIFSVDFIRRSVTVNCTPKAEPSPFRVRCGFCLLQFHKGQMAAIRFLRVGWYFESCVEVFLPIEIKFHTDAAQQSRSERSEERDHTPSHEDTISSWTPLSFLNIFKNTLEYS